MLLWIKCTSTPSGDFFVVSFRSRKFFCIKNGAFLFGGRIFYLPHLYRFDYSAEKGNVTIGKGYCVNYI